jgi:predicted nuclease of predicted toxin-antitoxin system
MIKILIDEDIPRSTLKVLNGVGYEVLDVRDYGLRGKSDEEIFKFAQQTGAVILTGDVGFGNLFRFLIGKHYGIFIVHFPNEISTSELNQQIMKALEVLIETDFIGNLIILEPGKIRVRRR